MLNCTSIVDRLYDDSIALANLRDILPWPRRSKSSRLGLHGTCPGGVFHNWLTVSAEYPAHCARTVHVRIVSGQPLGSRPAEPRSPRQKRESAVPQTKHKMTLQKKKEKKKKRKLFLPHDWLNYPSGQGTKSPPFQDSMSVRFAFPQIFLSPTFSALDRVMRLGAWSFQPWMPRNPRLRGRMQRNDSAISWGLGIRVWTWHGASE